MNTICTCGCFIDRSAIIDHLYSDEHTNDKFIIP